MREMMRGDQAFVGWNDISLMVDRAEKWLKNGEPFKTSLNSSKNLFDYVKQIRNVIAHESDSAYEKFLNSTRRIYGSVPRGCTPGMQLLMPPPSSMPGLTGASLLEAIFTNLEVTAKIIAR
jgi:hypothetical protein